MSDAPVRPGTMAAQTPQPFVTVRPVADMITADFLRHCRQRHRTMRFLTINEHQQHHRQFPAEDHTHTDLLSPDPDPERPDEATTPARQPRRRSGSA